MANVPGDNFQHYVDSATGAVQSTISTLVTRVIDEGVGGTITQDMVDQAERIKPVVDQDNG